jgi:hypothetical protein
MKTAFGDSHFALRFWRFALRRARDPKRRPPDADAGYTPREGPKALTTGPDTGIVRAMPSNSRAQHNYMEMIAHNPGKARKKGPSQAVAREFVNADKGRRIGDLVGRKK